jgi:hypothetical protein
MWRYSQTSGILSLTSISGYTFQCYSGYGQWKNRPEMESVADLGPIPCGIYDQGDVELSSVHGPFAIPLFPRPANEMFGRSGFMLHGDSVEAPGCASRGCIVHSPQADREIVYGSHLPIEVVP